MSTLSDNLLYIAILAYLGAMMLHTADYALMRRRPAVAAPAEAKVLVGAGGPEVAVNPIEDVQAPPAAPERRDWAPLFGKLAVWMTGLAVLLHFTTTATRGLAAHRMPWGNMYEFVLSVTLVGGAAWLVVAIRKPQVRRLGIVLTLVEMLLLGFAGLVLYTQVNPLVPALQSYWFVIHVTSVVLASGLFLVGFVPSAAFLIRDGYDAGKRRFPYSLGGRLPAADAMERLAFGIQAFAFPIWTFGVAAGAVWAEAAWGRYWGWDPKETWAFISWVVYAGYLHARSTPSMNRRLVAWIAIIGWLTMLMNLFGVNFFFTGLHSYAGVQ
ncbi:c-type cytochrome biogenesis protein CcsB [Hamadaea tsunoensis]|uniref:c-type cytochrome biogenesis protein CcsB n=1 Tax=Hamadaea tsunoensis TaxID=53368 RepID=UPI00048A157D|nr:c-type cytochrome biogenesis protein CcsB [Hamadaea tsunoensis]